MNKYRFTPYMSLDQARFELVEMGNNTGAEINNYVIRQTIGHLKAGAEFPVLDQLERYLLHKYGVLIKHYLGDSVTSSKNCVAVIRDKVNMAKAVDCKYQGEKQFIGDCVRHGFVDHNVFGSQNISYKCSLCIHEKMYEGIEPPDIIYHLDRNILVADFINRNKLDIEEFSNECKVTTGPLKRYLEFQESMTAQHWYHIKNCIKRYMKRKDYAISPGLEFRTIFEKIIERMEG